MLFEVTDLQRHFYGVSALAGKTVNRFKIQAFAIGGGLMGIAGALYGYFTSYIAPDMFLPLITIYIFLALTAGGTGNSYGAVAGAFLVIAILESARFLGDGLPIFDGAQVAALREITIALVLILILILILRFKPSGLIPERLPRHLPRAVSRKPFQ